MDLFAYMFHYSHGLLGLVILVLDIIAIVSLLTGGASVTHKLLWIILILFFPLLGVLLYYLIGKSRLDL